MIELPEATTLAGQLSETLGGKTIRSLVAAHSPHRFAFFSGEPEEYSRRLCGEAVSSARAVGGMIEVLIGPFSLTFNDGTNLRYLEPGVPPPKKHQLLVGFDDDSHLVCSVQMYGGIHLHDTGKIDNPYYQVARDKPTPLTEQFDLPYFMEIVRAAKPTLSAKALLATEQRIPGLGNGCLQDILFRAGIRPQTKLKSLAEGDFERLFDCVKRTLAAMAGGGGRDTEKDLFGNPGGYRCILSNNTYAYACPQCGGGIQRKAYLGGNVYFCPTCQPEQ